MYDYLKVQLQDANTHFWRWYHYLQNTLGDSLALCGFCSGNGWYALGDSSLATFEANRLRVQYCVACDCLLRDRVKFIQHALRYGMLCSTQKPYLIEEDDLMDPWWARR